MLSTDPLPETPLTLKERRPFSLTLTCEKQDKSRLDLTGATLRMVIADVKRKGGDAKVTVPGALVSATDGTARFDIQADELNFGAGTYDMAITLATAEGFESSIIEGPVQLTHNPDPTIPADHGGVVAPLSLTARFRDHNRVTVRVNHHPDSVLLDATARAETAASEAGLSRDAAAGSADEAQDAADTTAAAAADVAQKHMEIQGYRGDAVYAAQSAAASAEAAAGSAQGAREAQLAAEQIAQELEGLESQIGNDVFVLGPLEDPPFGRYGDLAVKVQTDSRISILERGLEDGTWSEALYWLPVPTGGNPGQVLTKGASTYYDWANPVAVAHHHDERYSQIGHTHDYAAAGHSHDGSYIPTTVDIKSIVKITQAAYDALGVKVADRLYVIVG